MVNLFKPCFYCCSCLLFVTTASHPCSWPFFAWCRVSHSPIGLCVTAVSSCIHSLLCLVSPAVVELEPLTSRSLPAEPQSHAVAAAAASRASNQATDSAASSAHCRHACRSGANVTNCSRAPHFLCLLSPPILFIGSAAHLSRGQLDPPSLPSRASASPPLR